MAWKRGRQSIQIEVSRLQSWVEDNDPVLNGPNGDNGMIREWQDFTAKREAFESFVKWMVSLIGLMVAFPAALVGLSALGIIHLR